MKHFPYVALLTAILLSACSSIPGLAQPTATPLPTDTPQPTFTPLPTETPKPTATSTPDAEATAASQATQAAADVLTTLDKVLGDSDIPYQDGHLVWQQTEPLEINMSGPDDGILALDEEVTADNFIMKFDVTWEATGLIVCGAIFRSEPDLQKGKQYQFAFLRFSGLPAWEIEVYEYGYFKNTPTKTKFSDALDLANGATNEFLLAVEDDHFTIYINGKRQGTYYDYSEQRLDGTFGFSGFQDSGTGMCEFENSWIWTLESGSD